MADGNEGKSASAASSEPTPRAGLRGFVQRHPQLASWAVLAVVMVAMVVWSAKDVNLLPSQLAAVIVATIGLAGLCVWIIGWD
jgi:hypothetical protein